MIDYTDELEYGSENARLRSRLVHDGAAIDGPDEETPGYRLYATIYDSDGTEVQAETAVASWDATYDLWYADIDLSDTDTFPAASDYRVEFRVKYTDGTEHEKRTARLSIVPEPWSHNVISADIYGVCKALGYYERGTAPDMTQYIRIAEHEVRMRFYESREMNAYSPGMLLNKNYLTSCVRYLAVSMALAKYRGGDDDPVSESSLYYRGEYERAWAQVIGNAKFDADMDEANDDGEAENFVGIYLKV